MNKEIRCAYVELKNKFGAKEDVILEVTASCNEIVSEAVEVKTRKMPKQVTAAKQRPVFRGSSATSESLIELQKHFNLN